MGGWCLEVVGLWGKEAQAGSKQSFFEKKDQKTFAPPACTWVCATSDADVVADGALLFAPAPDIPCMALVADLDPAAFTKADPSPDTLFYEQPRFVAHIDDGAIAAVTALYRETLPAGADILDLQSSWISHLPPDIAYRTVVGHGMNAAELARNTRLTRWFVQDLNADPRLPLPDASFDAAADCVSVQYLQRPMEVFREIARILRPGAPFVVSFSNRCFPTKAVAIWRMLEGADQQRLVAAYMTEAGFTAVAGHSHTPGGGDPLWAVIGTR